jgi:hypothetical protein
MSRYDDEDLATILDFMTRAATITAEQIARLRRDPGNAPDNDVPPVGAVATTD